MTLDLLLLGFGHVGRRFVRLLGERADRLAQEEGLTVRLAGVATRRSGCVRATAPAGLDPAAALAAVEGGHRLETLADVAPAADALALIRDAARDNPAAAEGRLIVVETTVLDIARGRPAIDHVQAALAAGAHVVTANKGPVAFAYDTLKAAADRAGRRFLFEGAVMDGIPVFNLARETMPVVTVYGFRGVINSTTNYILTAMEEGRGFEQALAEMQAAGIAEADASLDVDGWDAAAKTAALANVLMGAGLTPHDVRRTGIGGVARAAVEAAAAGGHRIKLVCSATRRGGTIETRVAPEELPAADLLAGLRGGENALEIDTDLLGRFAIVQRDSSLTQTAYALLADVVTVGRGPSPSAPPPMRPDRTP
ncbi:MAG: homoserine dehydrogenase [Acidobacteriota bacterium]|nr:homoserine dehydrogenase [Acidobacteriota bacterium]